MTKLFLIGPKLLLIMRNSLKLYLSIPILGRGVLYLCCVLLCGSCADKGTQSAKSAKSTTGCKIETKEVTENSVTDLPTIADFGGSTFIACKTGVIKTLTFKVAANSEAQPNAMFFLENGIGDGVIEEGSQTYADYVQDISIPGAGGNAMIQLTEPFPVEEGETYTWYVQKDPDAGTLVQAGGLDPNNGYEGGSSWYNNSYYRDSDNLFTISIE